MISLENAERLKELGLFPRSFEWYELRGIGQMSLFRPSLSQLLEEVEKRGYKWMMESGGIYGFGDECECALYEPPGEVMTDYVDRCKVVKHADTPEDAVALALIEIMEGT